MPPNFLSFRQLIERSHSIALQQTANKRFVGVSVTQFDQALRSLVEVLAHAQSRNLVLGQTIVVKSACKHAKL
jgi:hypothetical protein